MRGTRAWCRRRASSRRGSRRAYRLATMWPGWWKRSCNSKLKTQNSNNVRLEFFLLSFELHTSQAPPASCREQHARDGALGVPRAWCDVRGVIQIRALVERLDRRRPRRAARLADLMHRGGCRHVADLVAACAKTTAQIGVLPVQEVARVEAADLVECRAAHQHARAGHPVHGRTLAALAHHIAPRRSG